MDLSTVSDFSERDLLQAVFSCDLTKDLLLESNIFDVDGSSPSSSSPPPSSPISYSSNSSPTPDNIYQTLMKATIPVNAKRTFDKLCPNEMSDEISTKKQKSTEERDHERIEAQREASRRYRKKKKDLIEQLKHKLDEISEQKAKLEAEHKDIASTVNRLKRENNNLKQNHLQFAQMIEKERQSLLTDLEHKFHNGASDDELEEVLTKLDECCTKVILVGECHWKMLVSPSTAHHLAKSGFFPNDQSRIESVVESPSDTSSVATFAFQMLQGTPDITEEQRRKVNQLVTDYYSKLHEWHQEREHINAEINDYFTQQKLGNTGDFQKVVQLVGTLELLRNNFLQESTSWEAITTTITEVLTVRQKATFYLNVEFQHKAVMQLKSLWESLNSVVKK